MKKCFLLLLCMALLFFFAACEKKDNSAPPAQATIEIVDEADNDDIAISALKAFLEEDIYGNLTSAYEETVGQKAREFEITTASEYIIPDFEGEARHLLLINGMADVLHDNAILDRLILLVDLDNGAVYDQYSNNCVSFTGDLSTAEGKIQYFINVYDSFLMDCNDGYMTSPELETRNDLSAEEIAAINEAIR